MSQEIFAGIDSGSRLTKLIILQNGKIVHSNTADSGVNPQQTAKKLFERSLAAMGIEKVGKLYSTGYGRNIIPFSDKKISEISCHAKGINFLFPQARTVIDIGGQDSKALLVNEQGKVLDFAMNDKCAAGTGRFLEVAANILELTVEDLGRLSMEATEDIKMNSTCVVFAESEIIGLISQGKKREDIIRSIHRSIARRTKNLLSQLHWKEPLVFTGGVSQNTGMRKELSELLQIEILVPPAPLISGALGAALFAADRLYRDSNFCHPV